MEGISEELVTLIEKLFLKLDNTRKYNENKRTLFVKELIILIKRIQIHSLDEYISCIYVTARLALLKSLPTESITDVEDIVALVCHKPIFIEKDKIEQNVDKLSKLVMSIVKDAFELIYIIRKISHFNFFTYYVGISLIWAAFIRFTDTPVLDYKLYGIRKFLTIIDSISLYTIVKDVDELHKFLALFSLFQNIFILTTFNYKHGDFEHFFEIDQTDLDIIIHWLRSLKTLFEAQRIEYSKDDKRFEVQELLVLDILALFEPQSYY